MVRSAELLARGPAYEPTGLLWWCVMCGGWEESDREREMDVIFLQVLAHNSDLETFKIPDSFPFVWPRGHSASQG